MRGSRETGKWGTFLVERMCHISTGNRGAPGRGSELRVTGSGGVRRARNDNRGKKWVRNGYRSEKGASTGLDQNGGPKWGLGREERPE